jgi:hypothetical protein
MIYTSTRSKKHNSKTKKEIAEYEAWLASVNSMSSGMKKNKYGGSIVAKPKKEEFAIREPRTAKYVTGVCTTGGIMKDYHRLSKSDREIVDNLAMSVAPLHKSNYVYVSEGMNPASLGRKNEVL